MSKRTLKDELSLWRIWRNGQPGYIDPTSLYFKGFDFGIIGFPYQQGWISRSVVWILVVFGVEVLAIIPLQIIAGNNLSKLIALDFFLGVFTLSLFSFRVWRDSKLAFVGSLILLIPFTLLAILYVIYAIG